ncbi:MAG TPA: T9SS type A sorting domain-containing protein [Bacteroidia bacterium]|nr:T9SS type A sorting domain-containing protein [Bacteroidia bacterium]
MKNISLIFFVIILIAFKSNAQYVTIPDPAFRTYLQQKVPTCFNGALLDTTCVDLWSVDSINVSYMSITDLTGLQYFGFIQYLNCSHNFVTQLPPLQYVAAMVCSYNLLTSLNLAGVSQLNCSHNFITNITSFGTSNLHDINCSYNQLTSLPPVTWIWVGAWTYFNCSNNYISSIPAGYGDVYVLDVSNNNISILPTFTSDLRALYCSHNNLTTLDVTGASSYMDHIDCSYNQISTMSTGIGTVKLNCSHNQLTSLPLINNLYDLNCSNNQITSLAQCPGDTLNCSVNPINCLPTLNDHIRSLNIDSTQIICVPNYPLYYPINLPLCVPDTGICEAFPLITGTIYKDTNGNNIRDLGEPPLPNWIVQTLPYNWYGNSDYSGNYFVKADTGLNVAVSVPYSLSPYYIPSPPSYNFYFNAMNVQDSLNDFAVYPVPNVNDLKISICGFEAVPGDTDYYEINCFNPGTNSQNATVEFTFPDSMVLVNAYPVPNNINGHTITWNVNNFNSLDWFDASAGLAVPVTVPLGTPLHFEASIFPVANDSTPNDNIAIINDSVVSSYDPNTKEVSDTTIDLNDVADQKWLEYTIRFQNTGTYMASDIFIIDTLSAKLDIASFQVIGFSHPYDFTIREHGIIKFRFDNIMLPDSGSNQALSHGFIKYRVRCLNTLQLNNKIKNTSYIYFDFNVPVKTNQVTTRVVAPTFMQHLFKDEKLSVYPNPAKDMIVVTGNSCFIKSIRLFSIIGQKIYEKTNLHTMQAEISLGEFSQGTYLLKVENEKEILYRKIIKQ